MYAGNDRSSLSLTADGARLAIRETVDELSDRLAAVVAGLDTTGHARR